MGRKADETMPRHLTVLLIVLVHALSAAAGGWAAHAPRYDAPVPGPVVRGFEPPERGYGPGHRGVDLDADVGDPVGAAADGEVVHAGVVVGVTWVSIDHADGVRTSYGPLASLEVSAGDPVGRGQVLGRLAPGGHGHGGRDRGLHLGARRDGAYLDPLLLLRTRRASLVPPEGRAVGRAPMVGPRAPAPRSPLAPVGHRRAVPGPPVAVG